MIWFKRCALVAFLLAISVSSFVSSQDKAAPTRQNDSPAGMDEDTIDLTPSIELVSEKTEGDRGADQIVGQSSLSPLLGQSLLTPGPINTLSLLFPALSSALLWGNLFPPLSFLGPQALLGSTQVLGSSQSDQLPSASKVVLVLAEDRDPHVAMRAANQEAARTIRQNDVFGQLLSQIRQADLGQMLSQSLEQMQQQIPAQLLQQNAEQFLQQIVSQDVSQSLGQMLSQTFQPLPGLDLSQLPLLGQAPPSGEPAVVAALDQAEGGSEAAAAADDVLTPNTPAFQIPNIQSAIDASTQMLGQVFQQPNADANSGFQLPNIQSALDAGTQMLGQAFQQTNADGSSGGFQFPNIQSVIDSGSQMLSQSGGLFNLRPLQSLDPPMSDSDAEPAASQISEVRVKPDVSPTAQNERKMQTAAGMDELKMLSAMQKAFIHKKLPILWFRMPSDSPERDDDFELKHHANSKNKNMDEQLESKLQAFERQVIAELKFLQDIERKAKEMRAASKAGATDKTSKDATNHHASILSKIPVHKITRADIEKALNDDYVKKLLHMAAITNRKASEKTLNGAPSKRQTMTSKSSITPRQMSRDEIMRLLAYAYRMANANGIQMMEVSDSKKLNKPPQSDSEGSAKQLNDENWLRNSKARQWEGERMQMLRMQNFEQNPTRMSMDRQMLEKTTAMGRQSLDEQTPPINENPMQTKPMPMEQQRPAMQQMQRMQSPFTADQRQWIDPNMGMRSWMQENTQMPVQRQWIDTQSQRFPSENTQQPPATTEQSLPAMPILMAMQQPPMMMEEPRMAMQLPQADTQGGDGMMLQQMHPEMQRQMQELDMLGLATPQMPDNEGKARFKGHMFLDDFGKILKGKGKGKGVRPTIINYYYNAGGRRPSHVYSTYAGTSYGGGPSYGTSYGPSYGQSYGPSYGTSYGQSYSQSYGGSSGGAYRMAVGDDEIQAMLKEHNHMEMMPNTDPIPVIAAYAPTATFQSTTPPATDNLNQKQPVTETFPHNDKHNSAATATPPIAHTSKMSSCNESLETPFHSKDPEEVGSLFSYSPKMFEPFMGLQSVPAYESDPWNYKPYDLHHPLYESDGSYEPYINNKRTKRNTHTRTNHILTPSILDYFLKIRANFEKSFPQLYKTLRDQQRALNLTRVSVKPPVIPEEVAYPPTELGAAEMLPPDLSSTPSNEPTPKSDDGIDYFSFDDDDDD